MWLEMSRDAAHGGKGWGFTECLWSPTHKKPTGVWPFWELLRKVQAGDLVFHLRGKGKKAAFVGYSIADAAGYTTTSRPPLGGQWSYAASFYRVPLTGFVRFADPILLYDIFAERDGEMREYFHANRQKITHRQASERLFFVVQSGRLQCLNGAYLSEFGTALASIVLGSTFVGEAPQSPSKAVTVKTGEQIAQVRIRLGQSEFSDKVRQNYGHQCCFPGCEVSEQRLLVGAHIARWADAEHLRGEVSNGLCLCLFHDKMFELGLFTLTPDHRVAIDMTKLQSSPWSLTNVAPFSGQPIKLGAILPAPEPLKKHWERIGFAPGGN